MASQIAHVVYAKKYLERHPAMNADLFLLGTLFPDVRRVTDDVSRQDTHILKEDIDLDFKGASPFEAGWKFHLWCDMRRNEILTEKSFYDLKHASQFDVAPKVLEDELVYGKFQNWEKLRMMLDNPPEIKEEIFVSREALERWYAILAKYFEKQPDDKTIKAFLWKQRSLRKRADEIVDVIRKLRENQKAVEILTKISDEILG